MARSVAGTRTVAGARSVATTRITPRSMGTCLAFNGSTAFVGSMALSTRTAGLPFTASCWFQTQQKTTNITMLSVRNGSGAGNLWKLGLNAGNVIWNYDSTGSGVQLTSTKNTWADALWHLAVGVYDGANVILYIDGALAAITSGGHPNAAINQTLFGIGYRPDTSAEFFRGNLDECFVGNAAFTAQEVADLYYLGIYPAAKVSNKWLFDEGSGTTATDSVGGINGTITSATYLTTPPLKVRSAA